MSDHAGDSSAVILYYDATPIESIDSRTHRTIYDDLDVIAQKLVHFWWSY
jgi:hypothetical protein